ncbi:hypothetical protein [Leptolyngbya sp. 7M]|uniref:hypothetical protein n=1 Tax=Leptolyngbya sp. 7M TaxID=2812896 RepID=UPI001B8D516A|nr:hypothetical protein [Leptolyngbya sp. 7M]QYO63305.1 hypothetical protein JVX88_25735 [Leptolyngbya sp. 7M]
MKVGLLSFQASLWIVVGVLGGMGSVAEALPAIAQVEPMSDEFTAQRDDLASALPIANAEIPQLHELEQPAVTIEDWIAQIEASLVQITGVRVETTETGLQIILETADGTIASGGNR